MPLDQLLGMPWVGNPKEHDLDGIGESFRSGGFVDPIVLDEGTGRIVAGHGRLKKLALMRDAGEEPPEGVFPIPGSRGWLVPTLRGIAFASPEAAERYLLASNRLVERGGYDQAALAAMLDRHRDDLSGTGYDRADVDRVMSLLASSSEPNDVAAEWQGMPEFDQPDAPAHRSIVVHFKDQAAVDAFAQALGAKLTPRTRYLWYPEIEIGRLADKHWAGSE